MYASLKSSQQINAEIRAANPDKRPRKQFDLPAVGVKEHITYTEFTTLISTMDIQSKSAEIGMTGNYCLDPEIFYRHISPQDLKDIQNLMGKGYLIWLNIPKYRG